MSILVFGRHAPARCIAGLCASLACAPLAHAGQCSATARFDHAWNGNYDDFNIQFHVRAYGCDRSTCSGWIKYIVHYTDSDGRLHANSATAQYHVREGQERADVTDKYTHVQSGDAHVDAVDVEEVSCSN